MYAVILAGGGGTRLWPLSTPARPKPFLPLLPDGSLLQRTVARVSEGPKAVISRSDITVVTDQRYRALVAEQLPDIAVVSEPFGRNTAAAIALATLAIDRAPDEVMVVLPADHAIADDKEGVFRGVLADAERELALGAFEIESPLVTLGAQANRAATEYGYLIPQLEHGQTLRLTAYPLSAFVEKPDATRATELRQQAGVAWNAGIFMARRRAFRAAFESYTGLVGLLEPALSSADRLHDAYKTIVPTSIDYAVMQPAARDGHVVMGAMEVGWSDLGTWTALIDRLTGGYDAEARVVPAGETVSVGPEDILVLRGAGGRLDSVVGQRDTITSPEPMGLLPAARQLASAIEALLERVNLWEAEHQSLNMARTA